MLLKPIPDALDATARVYGRLALRLGDGDLVVHVEAAQRVQGVATATRVRHGARLATALRAVEVDVALPVRVRGETATAERLLRVVHDVLEVDVVAVVRDGVR